MKVVFFGFKLMQNEDMPKHSFFLEHMQLMQYKGYYIS